MTRLELIANASVEENILETLKSEGIGQFYTKIVNVYGVGSSGPRMGDAVWPESNFVMIFWCEEEEAKSIERAVTSIKERFPEEGIKLFGTEVSALASVSEAAAKAPAAKISLPSAQAEPEIPKRIRNPDFGGEQF